MTNEVTSNTSEKGRFRKAYDAGYRRFVPVIPPNAELSEHFSGRAKIDSGKEDPRGKMPGWKWPDGWSGMRDFATRVAAPADCDKWESWGASLGLVMGYGLVAVDIDVTDDGVAREIHELALDMLGPTPARYGNAPKVLLLYRCADVAFDRVFFDTPTKSGELVEILGEGRQIVAQGIHPKTGQPYRWDPDMPRRDEITETTPEDIEAFLETLMETRDNAERSSSGAVDRSQIDQAELRAEPAFVADLVERIPNVQTEFPSRQDYLNMGYAIKAACGEENEARAFDIFSAWCYEWDGGENDTAVVESDWSRMKGPFSFGVQYLIEKAQKFDPSFNGMAQHLFQPLGDAPAAPAAPAPAQTDGTPGEGLGEVKGEVDLDIFAPKPAEHPSSSLYQFKSIRDVIDAPPVIDLIQRHVPKESFGILYGKPGTFKSFFALDMALSIGFGFETWQGDRINNDSDAHVLYIAAEGAAGFRKRVGAWLQYHEIDPGQACKLHFLQDDVNFMSEADIVRLVRSIEEQIDTKLCMIVVDTLSRVIPGADENLQKEMSLFVAACKKMQAHFGATVMAVHHESKSGDLRGASVFRGGVDFLLHSHREKGKTITRLEAEKSKDGSDGWMEPYEMLKVEHGLPLPEHATTDDETSLVPLRTFETDAKNSTGSLSADEVEQIRDMVDTAWNAGAAYSKAKNTGDRYLGKALERFFDVSWDEAVNMVDMLLSTGIIEERVKSSRSKSKGLHSKDRVDIQDLFGAPEDTPVMDNSELGSVFE